MRKKVVLPAPSGPISANISPVAIVSDRSFSATMRPEERVSERAANTVLYELAARRHSGDRRRRLHVNLGRLARYQHDAPSTREVDLRAVDQIDPLGPGFDGLGREL